MTSIRCEFCSREDALVTMFERDGRLLLILNLCSDHQKEASDMSVEQVRNRRLLTA